jgi:hypothetical protein
MSVLEKMLKIRQTLIEQDRDQVMAFFTELLHYKIASRVTDGDEFAVFRDESQLMEFCKNNNLDQRALSWLLDAMRAERLIAPVKMPVILTPLGVEKFCSEVSAWK